jgi:nitrite reductase (NADH) large subunit
VVIIGCGVAGITAAQSLRNSVANAEISIYTDEIHLYYPRPRLYEVMSGEKKPEEIYTHPPQFYESQRIRVTLNDKATKINPGSKQLLTQAGQRVNYDKLLLANGAHPFKPPLQGAERIGIFTLRTISDALAIKEYAEKTSKVIVIGGGLLGLEFAASLKKLGKKVDVVEINSRLLPNELDQDGATILKEKLEALNIHPFLGVQTKEILGKNAVSGVLLDDGEELSGGLILIAAGIKSNVDLAAEAGIRVNRGVIVDQHLRTSDNDIYAAGDIAEFNGRVYGIIPPAIEQAKVASANVLGENQVYKGTVHTTTLKIAGISLTSMGIVNPEDRRYKEIKKTNKQEGIYKKIVLDQGKIVGAILLGDRKGSAAINRLMDQETDVTKYEESILEDNFDYRKFLG